MKVKSKVETSNEQNYYFVVGVCNTFLKKKFKQTGS